MKNKFLLFDVSSISHAVANAMLSQNIKQNIDLLKQQNYDKEKFNIEKSIIKNNYIYTNYEKLISDLTLGIMRKINKVLKDNKSNINNVVLFYDGDNNWRKKINPEYKGTREKDALKPVIHNSINIIYDIMNEKNIEQYISNELEADDLIFLKTLEIDNNSEIYIVSNDIDLQQISLYKDNISIITNKDKLKLSKLEAIETVILKIIGGDPSDNLPKTVKGLGKVGIKKMISEIPNVENLNINDIIEQWIIPKIIEKKIKSLKLTEDEINVLDETLVLLSNGGNLNINEIQTTSDVIEIINIYINITNNNNMINFQNLPYKNINNQNIDNLSLKDKRIKNDFISRITLLSKEFQKKFKLENLLNDKYISETEKNILIRFLNPDYEKLKNISIEKIDTLISSYLKIEFIIQKNNLINNFNFLLSKQEIKNFMKLNNSELNNHILNKTNFIIEIISKNVDGFKIQANNNFEYIFKNSINSNNTRTLNQY